MSDKQREAAGAMSADDAAFHFPPPSYEEVMGVYQTSVKGQANEADSDLPPLAYMDIMPRCIHPGNIKGQVPPKFENFSSIMAGVNMWLRDNPGYRVWKCESIERQLNTAPDGSVSYQLIDMTHHESIFGYCVYIRGLRLWLTKSIFPGSPPQVLGVRNLQPTKMTIELPRRGCYQRGRVIIGDEVVGHIGGGMSTYETFAGLQDSLVHMNKELASNPIPGSILTIETDSVKAFDMFRKDLDPDSTCWSEDKIRFRRITQVVRIFYVEGPPAKETIAVEDFEPDILDVGDTIKPPKLASLQDTINKVNRWLPQNQDKKIVNIQQFDARLEAFWGKVNISSDSTDEMVSFTKTTKIAKVIRLFYVTTASHVAPPITNYVTSRDFLPARLGGKKFENMNQTMARIDAWLRLTGVPIYNVESVKYLYNEYQPQGADTTSAQYTLHGNSGKHWVTAIRVYFPCQYQEPDPALLPPLPKSKGSSSCTML